MNNISLPLIKESHVSNLCSDDCYEIVISIGKSTCSELQNKDGFDKSGFNKDGFDKDGFNKDDFDESGFNKDGFDKDGFNKDGFDESGFDESGFNKDGFDKSGFDKSGFDKSGFNKDGFDKSGFNKDGFDKSGFDKSGFNKDGFDKSGFNKDGFDKDGFNKDGFNKDVAKILSEFAISINPVTRDIIDSQSHKPTGQNLDTCAKVLNDYSDTLIFYRAGYLKANCGRSWHCKDCIDAINSSIITTAKTTDLGYNPTVEDQYENLSLYNLINMTIWPEIDVL